jgi:2-C-methyl-D-erythritol 2,4-cyclodiphosphate synthase
MRIGYGYDAHRFRDGGRLVIGGVGIPHDRSLAAHSDGDVLLHAICDALLGAAALGDIGRHFPDSNPEFKGISSRVLLQRVVGLLKEKGLRVANIDATLVAERPRFAPFIELMRRHIAADCEIDVACVNVKATTTEGMGFAGRQEGIAAHAVALLDDRAP